MTIPALEVPKLLLFVEAAQILMQASQVLLAEGHLEADMPELIQEAQELAEAQLQNHAQMDPQLRQQVRDILLLTPPDRILGLIQDVIDQGQGPDLNQFLAPAALEHSGDPGDLGNRETSGSAPLAMTRIQLPKVLLCTEAVCQLLDRMDFSAEEQQAVQTNLADMEHNLAMMAAAQQIDPNPIRQIARHHFIQLPLDDLLDLVQQFIQEEDALRSDEASSESSELIVAGPVMFLEIADYLLKQNDWPLTPDQQLDLVLNQAKAEAKLDVMQKLGRIENLEEQQSSLREWIQSQSVTDLLQILDQLFEQDQEEQDQEDL